MDKWLARLVAKGFKQRKVSITSIRQLIALAAIQHIIIHMRDVKSAFLNVDLEEEMLLYGAAWRIRHSWNENKVYKLIKWLYGIKLKQAP